MAIKAILLDWDGTISDVTETISTAFNNTLEHYGK